MPSSSNNHGSRPSYWQSLVLTIGLVGCASTSQAETLTIYNDATGDSYISLDQPDGVGDKILWNSDMQTADGDIIGTGSGHCTQLDAARNFFCSFVIDLAGRGMISGQGVQKTEPLESSFPITGGTGEFEGITGEMKSTPVEDRARFIYEIDYRRPTAN